MRKIALVIMTYSLLIGIGAVLCLYLALVRITAAIPVSSDLDALDTHTGVVWAGIGFVGGGVLGAALAFLILRFAARVTI